MGAVDAVNLACLYMERLVAEDPRSVGAWLPFLFLLAGRLFHAEGGSVIQALVYFSVCHEPLLGRCLVCEIAVILRNSNVVSNLQVVAFMVNVHSHFVLLLELPANGEEPVRKLLLQLIYMNVVECLTEVCFVLGHEVLDLPVHLASKKLEPQDYLLLVKFFNKAVRVGRLGFLCLMCKLIVLSPGDEIDEAVQVGSQLNDAILLQGNPRGIFV